MTRGGAAPRLLVRRIYDHVGVTGNLAVDLLRRLVAGSTRARPGVSPPGRDNPRDSARLSAAPVAERDALIAEASADSAAGRFGEALALIGRGLAVASNNPELLFARSSML